MGVDVTRRLDGPTGGRQRRTRIRAAAHSVIALCLALAVTVPEPVYGQAWQAALTVVSGLATIELVLGQHPEATAGLDGALGEYELPPLPPSGSFDARFMGGGLGNGCAVDLLPWDPARTDTLVVGVQWIGGARSLRWDAGQMATRTSLAALTDSRGGQLGVDVDMRAVGEVVITNTRVERLWLVVRSAPAADSTAAVRWLTWGELKTARP
jgi:hypothetical protein